MSQVLDNQVNPNDYNFTEKENYGSPVSILITNSSARTVKFAETVFFNGWIGNVIEQDGIAAGDTGYINVNPNRNISMNQVDVADTFAANDNPIYFVPQTDSAVGYFQDTTAATSVLFNAEVIGADPTADTPYIEFKPPYQDGNLAVVGA